MHYSLLHNFFDLYILALLSPVVVKYDYCPDNVQL